MELERFRGPLLHEEALALNCGRCCLAYLLEARSIRTISVPDYICGSVLMPCEAAGVSVERYQVGPDFQPVWETVRAHEGYLYLVDYFGQLDPAAVERGRSLFEGRIIIDESQNYFASALPGVDTLYTARKFFGVSDGAFLSTDVRLSRALERDESRLHMDYLLGRLERSAEEFFKESQENNERFAHEPVKLMSATTENLLRGIDYAEVARIRQANYRRLAEALDEHNGLSAKSDAVPFAYPFLVEDGPTTRKRLAAHGIYVATLWPDVLRDDAAGQVAQRYARDILPLPVDQRYGRGQMDEIIETLKREGAF